jgi:ABC-2 type transport system permease protein
VVSNLKKWIETIRIGWSMVTAYRLNFFLLIIGPALVFYFIKVSLWSAVYETTQTTLNGYTLAQMLQYHAWSLIVILLAQSSNGVNLAEDIRLGRISKYLIYPFNFWEFHTASFISFQTIQLVISAITLLILSALGLINIPNFSTLIIGLSYSTLVGIFWFSVQYTAGLMAFWLEETWTLRVMFQILVNFLSGAILPLDFFPSWASDLLFWTPFPSLTYTPIKIFMGDTSGVLHGIGMISLAIVIMTMINTWTWRRGLRLFTAAGM